MFDTCIICICEVKIVKGMKRSDLSRVAIFIFILWAFDIVLIFGGLISEGRFPRKKCFLFGLVPKQSQSQKS